MLYPSRSYVRGELRSREQDLVGLDIGKILLVKFFCHRHRETFLVYYGYFAEELKERNTGRLKHIITVCLA